MRSDRCDFFTPVPPPRTSAGGPGSVHRGLLTHARVPQNHRLRHRPMARRRGCNRRTLDGVELRRRERTSKRAIDATRAVAPASRPNERHPKMACPIQFNGPAFPTNNFAYPGTNGRLGSTDGINNGLDRFIATIGITLVGSLAGALCGRS